MNTVSLGSAIRREAGDITLFEEERTYHVEARYVAPIMIA